MWTVFLSKAEINGRFAALNPHGALDFYLPGEGNISEYVGMLKFTSI
jgi:hypothetical protein